MSAVNHVPDWFGERSARGMLTRMVGAWLLVGLPVIAARIWWSGPAAIAVFVFMLTRTSRPRTVTCAVTCISPASAAVPRTSSVDYAR
jgi:hypothetical protein